MYILIGHDNQRVDFLNATPEQLREYSRVLHDDLVEIENQLATLVQKKKRYDNGEEVSTKNFNRIPRLSVAKGIKTEQINIILRSLAATDPNFDAFARAFVKLVNEYYPSVYREMEEPAERLMNSHRVADWELEKYA